jgi:hypothetical protein
MGLFKTGEIADIGTAGGQITANNDKQVTVLCKSPAKLAALVSAVNDGTTTFFLSDGDWSMHDLILELLVTRSPASLFITTYAIRDTAISPLIMAVQNGLIKELYMYVDYRAEVRTNDVFQLVKNNADKIAMGACHAKITVLQWDGGYVTIIGSANYTKNPRVEAGTVTCDKEVAIFFINNIKNLIENGEKIFK